MLNPIEPKKRTRESIGIKIKRGDLLLKTRGGKKLIKGSYEGKKRTERAALSKKGVEKKKKDKNKKEKREEGPEMRSNNKKKRFLN